MKVMGLEPWLLIGVLNAINQKSINVNYYVLDVTERFTQESQSYEKTQNFMCLRIFRYRA